MDKNKTVIIKLSNLLNSDTVFGNEEGRETFQKLANVLDGYPGTKTFGISLEGIKITDASFPRESVISLIKSKKGETGFYLSDFLTNDLMDNWDYAAKAKNQPVIVLGKNGYEMIGPALNSGAKELLDFIMIEGIVTTSKVVDKFGVSTQNASAKLKRLLQQGVILGSKEPAASGGLEFVYKAIK